MIKHITKYVLLFAFLVLSSLNPYHVAANGDNIIQKANTTDDRVLQEALQILQQIKEQRTNKINALHDKMSIEQRTNKKFEFDTGPVQPGWILRAEGIDRITGKFYTISFNENNPASRIIYYQ